MTKKAVTPIKKTPTKPTTKAKLTNTKKNVKKPTSTKKPVKKKVVKKPPTKTTKKPKASTPPKKPKAAGYGDGSDKVEPPKREIKPRQLRKKKDLWGTIDNTKKEPEERGPLVLVFGPFKSGKTKFCESAVEFKGFKGKKFIVPLGSPVYILDTERSAEFEAQTSYTQEYNNNQLLVHNCYIEDPKTGELDPVKSFIELEEWAYALSSSQAGGTLIIDSFTDYCSWAYDKLVIDILGYEFDENRIEKKKPSPMQYKWLNKKITSFLRKLRNMKMNVILTAHAKDEYEGEGFDAEKTGRLLADVHKKAPAWIDLSAVLVKEVSEDGEMITRVLQVTDSRFETVNMKDVEYELIDDEITYSNLIDLIKDWL